MRSLPILWGPDFHGGPGWQREERHRAKVRAKCAPVTVTPDRLAACVNRDGEINVYDAERLVRALIDEAHERAVAQTLGIDPVAGSS